MINVKDFDPILIKIDKNSDDDLPLNKILELHMLTVILRSVFEEDGKYYPEVFLDEFLYKGSNMIVYIFQKELILVKQMHQKSVTFYIIGIF